MTAAESSGRDEITEPARKTRRVALRYLAILNLLFFPLWIIFAFGSASLLGNTRSWEGYVMLYSLLAHIALTPYSLFHDRAFGSTRLGRATSMALTVEQVLPIAALTMFYVYLALASGIR